MLGSHWFCLLRQYRNRLHCWARSPTQVTTTGDGASLLQWWGPAAIYWRSSFESIPSLSSRVPLLYYFGAALNNFICYGRKRNRKVVGSNFGAALNIPFFQRDWFTQISIEPRQNDISLSKHPFLPKRLVYSDLYRTPTKWYQSLNSNLKNSFVGVWFTLTSLWAHLGPAFSPGFLISAQAKIMNTNVYASTIPPIV